MPKWRVSGDISYPGVVIVEAKDLNEAIDLVFYASEGLDARIEILDVAISRKLAAFKWDGDKLELIEEGK